MSESFDLTAKDILMSRHLMANEFIGNSYIVTKNLKFISNSIKYFVNKIFSEK